MSREKLLPGNCKRVTGGRNLVSVYTYLPSPRRCPICCESLNPLKLVKVEKGKYISEYKLTFPEIAWDVGYLTHPCFCPHLIKLTKAEKAFKVWGEVVLDKVIFWFKRIKQQEKALRTPPIPPGLGR